MDFTIESDVGLKRTVNEDRAHVSTRQDGLMLALLADGMGGHNAGEVASDMTITLFEQYFLQADKQLLTTFEQKQQWLAETVKAINTQVYDYSLLHEQCAGMGTTLIAALIEGEHFTICHIGDSRLYTFTEHDVVQVTRDHSYVNVLVDHGEISEEEAQLHPRRNVITKAIGTDRKVEPTFYELVVEPQMYVLLCSDGLSDKCSMEEMQAILLRQDALAHQARMLVQLANDSGGEDNITLVLLYNS